MRLYEVQKGAWQGNNYGANRQQMKRDQTQSAKQQAQRPQMPQQQGNQQPEQQNNDTPQTVVAEFEKWLSTASLQEIEAAITHMRKALNIR